MDRETLENIQIHFAEHKYVIIKKFISHDIAYLLYKYAITQAQSAEFKKANAKEKYCSEWDGRFDDPQSLGDYSRYGDPLMDTLLNESLQNVSMFTGVELVPTYSYWRLYERGSVLERHKDRESCEISTTLCLGYNSNYNWPIWVENPNTKAEVQVDLEPGDMIIYRGCEIDHWRERYEGLNHAQVFLHYNDANGPFNTKHDGRQRLGIPFQYKTTLGG